MGRSLTFTLTLAFISAFANIGGSAQQPTNAPTIYSTSTSTHYFEPPWWCYEDDYYRSDDEYFCDPDSPYYDTSTPTTSPTAAPTEVDCDTDQVLTVAVETDYYFAETSWVVEKYENDVWTEVASTNLLISPNTLFTNTICLDEAGVYRFSIFDWYGECLCLGNNCGFFEVRLNGNVIAEGDSFVQDVTDFNTCVNESGEFTYQGRTRQKSGTCDQLSKRQKWGGGIACRKNNLDGLGLVRDFCPNTCGLFGEGECASPNGSF